MDVREEIQVKPEVVLWFSGRVLAWLLGTAVVAGCQAPALAPVARQTPPAVAEAFFDGWEARPMPGKRWAPFEAVMQSGRAGLEVRAQSSLSLMRKRLHVPPALAGVLRFSWWVDDVLPDADLSQADASDAPAQVLVAFDGDRSLFSARNAMVSELTLLLTGEELPYASLVYVWANEQAPGTVIPDPRTDRIRYLVVEQGARRTRQWLDYERDIHADFRKAFGEAPGAVVGLALMTDTDNTRGRTRAVFGPVRLQEPPR